MRDNKDEIRIFLRFIKEKKIYNRVKHLLIIIKEKNCPIVNIFDKNIVWRETKEGHKFWYLIQLDFVKLLIIHNNNNFYRQYYFELLRGYDHEKYLLEKKLIEHIEFSKSIRKI